MTFSFFNLLSKFKSLNKAFKIQLNAVLYGKLHENSTAVKCVIS